MKVGMTEKEANCAERSAQLLCHQLCKWGLSKNMSDIKLVVSI